MAAPARRNGTGPSTGRFRPAQTRRVRRRRWAAIGVCIAITLLAASFANRQRVTLRCEGGRLVAYRGRPLPAGEVALPTDRFPPLSVDEDECRDRSFAGLDELQAHYLVVTLTEVDRAIARSGSSSELESAASTVDQLGRRPELEEFMSERRRALLVSLVESDLEEASTVLSRIRSRLRAAEGAGVSPTVVRALEDQLSRLLEDSRPHPRSTDEAPPVDAPMPEPIAAPASRSL